MWAGRGPFCGPSPTLTPKPESKTGRAAHLKGLRRGTGDHAVRAASSAPGISSPSSRPLRQRGPPGGHSLPRAGSPRGLQVGDTVLPAAGGDPSRLTDPVGTRILQAHSSQAHVLASTWVGGPRAAPARNRRTAFSPWPPRCPFLPTDAPPFAQGVPQPTGQCGHTRENPSPGTSSGLTSSVWLTRESSSSASHSLGLVLTAGHLLDLLSFSSSGGSSLTTVVVRKLQTFRGTRVSARPAP